jgi:penicillin-binding protein 1A
MGKKLPQPAVQQTAAANGTAAPKIIDIKPGPPPVLTRRGADILVQVEKMLDDAARTAEKTSATEPAKQGKSTSSSALAFPENYAAATASDAATPRKN